MFLSRTARRLFLVLLLALWPLVASAHIDTPTLMLLKVDGPRSFSVRIDADLLLVAGSAERYYTLATRNPGPGDREVQQIAAKLGDQLKLFAGTERIRLDFKRFIPAVWAKGEPTDSTSVGKRSTFLYEATAPESAAPIRLVTPVGVQIEFPIAFSVQVADKNISVTRWLVSGMRESDPVDWVTKRQPQDNVAIYDDEAVPKAFDADMLSWWQQFPTYLQLGFRHIIPEGTDHILFVMGLFFLGMSWRYIISQTTIFTIAHATTLFLATYGIFRLPPQYVEPTIALSIAVIAIENVFRPRLGPGRLVVVFVFGLIHGLGFAASLSEVPFPRNDFVMALLGFNVGVDLGQLFIIGILALCLGWASRKSWYRAAIAIPASVLIAAVGIVWAAERFYLYRAILLP